MNEYPCTRTHCQVCLLSLWVHHCFIYIPCHSFFDFLSGLKPQSEISSFAHFQSPASTILEREFFRAISPSRVRSGDEAAEEDEEDGDADRIDAVLDGIMVKFETDTGLNLLSLSLMSITNLKSTAPQKQEANE